MLFFMVCFFGYMDFMILYKWVTPMANPPSIINSLICMMMGGNDPAPLFEGSVFFQKILWCIIVATVPLMLIPKPLILWQQSKQSAPAHDEEQVAGGAHGGHGGGHAGGHGGGNKEGHEGQQFQFGEVMIHQIIETIEYVLGTVSHTASYLRLWALSLAHQQLSLVFFQKTIMAGMMMSFPMNGVVLYFMYMAWFGITCGVLLGMDVMECFLHTLRLHWVEFQSKFYKADGYEFAPYRHDKVLKPQVDG
jgi:V-type H+-transporting ATPase subunit a